MKNHVRTFALSLPLVLAGAGSALAAEAGAAADAPVTCSEATLRGTYLFATNGLTVHGKNQVPFAASGYEVYDGHGHVKDTVSFSVNGKITRHQRLTGTYTVNADCTGTATYYCCVTSETNPLMPLDNPGRVFWPEKAAESES